MKDYCLIISRIIERKNTKLFAEDELKNMQDASKYDENNLFLAIQSISYIFKQSLKFILKPTVLQKQLIEELKFDTEKAEEFVKQWTTETKLNFENLEDRHKLENVCWELNLQVASSCSNKEKIPSARIQLDLEKVKDGTKDDVILELNQDELVQLYTTLENIQLKLDFVNSSYNK